MVALLVLNKCKHILPIGHKYSFSEMFTPLSDPNRTKSLKLEKANHKYLEQFQVYLPKFWNTLCFETKNFILFEHLQKQNNK